MKLRRNAARHSEVLLPWLPLSCLLLLASCAGVGIVASSDPLTKLNDAQVLFSQKNRPVPADKLINEAIAIYQSKDDAHGLGNAYREYGDFLRSQAVANWEPQYRRNGFFDRSVTFDNRLDKAREFYGKALEAYAGAVPQLTEKGRYDALTNIYFNMAWVHLALNQKQQACESFERTLKAYDQNMQHYPSANPIFTPGFNSLPEALQSARQRAGCAAT
jgi:tetratricopeptide (TPR) repeat protein